MRIRRSASRLLGSAYSASAVPPPDAAPPFLLPTPPTPPPPPTPPHLAPCSAVESRGGARLASPETASGEHCELSRSPWDLIAELALSDPQVEDDLVDKYFVNVACRASWLFTASMPVASVKKKKPAGGDSDQPRREVAKKVQKKAAMSKEKEKEKIEGEAKKKAKVNKKEEGEGARVWKCKKNDGKRWHCHRTVSRPNTLCDYHFCQKRSYCGPGFEFASAVALKAEPVSAAASKPSTSSKPRKKKSTPDFGATEGFYYYAGFGPFRSKRQCRSNMHDSVPPKQEEEDQLPPEDASPTNQAQGDDTNQAAAQEESGEDIAGIAGVDEESSDDGGLGAPGRDMNGDNKEPRVGNGDGKRKNPCKRWRKPVKARSLKSLM